MMEICKKYYNKDRKRKVEIYKREDETYGFEEYKYGEPESAWFPTGQYSHAIFNSLETAMREVSERIIWLKGTND